MIAEKNFVDILLYSYDVSVLELSMGMIMQRMDRTDLIVRGPIPIPTKKRRFTVNRDPHMYNNSREHYALFSHCRLLRIMGSNPRLVSSLTDVDLPAGVDVRIKVVGS